MWWTRNEVLNEFVRLSGIIHEKEADGTITYDEATLVIDRYRERADELLLTLKREKVNV